MLNLFHIAAAQQGNVIQVKTGWLGVDEACSGIRSLQAIFVVSLFLGEIYQTSWPRRIAVVLAGALIALACNVGRTVALSAVAVKSGIDAVSSWHDPLGIAAFALCLLIVCGLARLTAGPLPKPIPSKSVAVNVFPRHLAFGLGAWILFTVIGTEIWYRSHETDEKARWSVAWPADKRDFSEVQLSERELDALACNERRSAEWTNSDGSHWTAFFFRWNKGPSASRIHARAHRPENCFPGAGYKLLVDRGNFNVQIQNLSIPFHALDFEREGERLHVFFCLSEDGLKPTERPRIQDEWNPVARLESVVLGKRNLGQQVLEIVISGYDTSDTAGAAFRREIVGMIRTHA